MHKSLDLSDVTPADSWISPSDLAKLVGVSKAWVSLHVERLAALLGGIEVRRGRGTTYRFPIAAVNRYARERERYLLQRINLRADYGVAVTPSDSDSDTTTEPRDRGR